MHKRWICASHSFSESRSQFPWRYLSVGQEEYVFVYMRVKTILFSSIDSSNKIIWMPLCFLRQKNITFYHLFSIKYFFITKKLQGCWSYSAFPLVSAWLLGEHPLVMIKNICQLQNAFSKPLYERILKSRLVLFWFSETTILEATAAPCCCGSSSPGSTEMGAYNFARGNLLKFKNRFSPNPDLCVS